MKFLVIRTDNIGDLICTTPLIHTLRKHYPSAKICAFVNSYNAPVLDNNPDLDAIYAYTKGKHRGGFSLIGTHWRRIKLLWQLRRERFDYAILAGAALRPKGLKFARLIKAKHIIGYTESHKPLSKYIDMGLPYIQAEAKHEVENTHKLLSTLNIFDEPPALVLEPNLNNIAAAKARVEAALADYKGQAFIGLHISARLEYNRWTEDKFIALIKKLWEHYHLPMLLFWSPGSETNAMHPGDDEKAARILAASAGIPIFGFETKELSELIAGLSLCQSFICSDGGAMHVAVGLKKPMVCFFGETEIKHWYPWKVPYRILQAKSLQVKDIEVDAAFKACVELMSSM